MAKQLQMIPRKMWCLFEKKKSQIMPKKNNNKKRGVGLPHTVHYFTHPKKKGKGKKDVNCSNHVKTYSK
jgi:hypothetical protein